MTTRRRRIVMAVLIVVGMGILFVGRTPPPPPIQIDEAANGTTVSITPGATFVIALQANPSTGYSWQVQPIPDPAVVSLVSEAYVQAPAASGLVGAGGTDTFTFKVLDSGTTTLTLWYLPPGRTDPASTFSVTIEAHTLG